MPKIRKAVFPAAGFGTRFLPVTKAQPKEMLPVVDKPVIQYLVEEAVNSGIEEIVIVTGRGKRSIEDHFDYSFELEHNLVEKRKHDLLEEVRKVSNLAKFIYVRQPQPLGDGHAILCAKEVIGNEPFAVLFGDDLVDSETPAIQQLMNVYEKTESCVIGLEKIPLEDSNKYGMVVPKSQNGREIEIKSLVEKPDPKDAPSDLGIIGKYVCTPEIFAELEKAESATRDGEIRLIDGFRSLINKQPIYGYELEGTRYDCGTKIGLIKATLNWALKRPDLGPRVEEFLHKNGFKAS
ncbi:UTP--glucose-1-phosphate uridylyltransferase GalU [Candidatus Peregrinibacteria bacterium]|jgi:UTP--glucose-1-phosphate uridylyltransferase|nr:UTP--glucose-1-phosphate uridylyltransferase GalU [Candidatus Peregrinibacteria bacterium]MBT7484563.1 UTP--glucose-1-phosphate uridylyltransferase GalU [Candidatus Peregrinibacteria bacterium]MBT7703605.1 UTP--glucose-1-phosphate uridylyltransferase GalU [Candidatus Peregrinibacteria bacterium]